MEDLVVVVAESDKETNTEGMEVAKNNDLVVVAEVSDDDDAKTTATEPTRRTKKKKQQNLIQVSNRKKPFIFYLNLAKRYIKQYNDVELCALGMAIPTVVTISEILKRNGLAIQKYVKTSMVDSKGNDEGRLTQKAKIEIVMEKAEKLDKTTAVTASEKAADTNA